MQGDLASARAAAEKTRNTDLLEAILLDQGDWKALADRPLPVENTDPAWAIGVKAAYQRRAGKQEEFERALAQLRRVGGDAWPAADALFFNDRPHEAIALLAQGTDHAAAGELLALQWRFAELADLVAKVRAEGSAQRFALEAIHARTLYRLGEQDRALTHFRRLGKELTDERSISQAITLIQTEYRTGLKDLAFEHCAAMMSHLRNEVPKRLLEPVFPKQGVLAEAWWRHLRAKAPGAPLADTLGQMRRLFEGKLGAAESTAMLQGAEQAARKLQGTEYPVWLQRLAETAQTAGRDDPARTYLDKLVEVAKTPDAHLKLGNFLAGKREWRAAAEQYRLAWEQDKARPTPLYLRGWALTKAGQEKEGWPLMELAHWLPLGNEESRYQLAEALMERELFDYAARELQLLIRLGTTETDPLPNALGRLADVAVSRKDFLLAGSCMERVVLLCLRTQRRFVKTEGYVLAPLLAHQYRLRGLVAAGRPVAEWRPLLRHNLDVFTADPNLAIHLVPELAKRGLTREADELFTTSFSFHAKVCSAYPRSGTAHNGLAWLAARCRRQLDVALEHARKAVELAPDEPAFADTLAEIHFQRGAKDEAIACIKKCIALDPKREYFKKQLKRFEANDPLTEPDD
jgi:tetratricopeptide (TPR) repeat protein